MNTRRVTVATLSLVLLGALIVQAVAQLAGFKRTVLQRGDLSVPGREAVTALAEIPAGVAVGKRTHPGEELGYVLEGTTLAKVLANYVVEKGKPLASPVR